MKIMKLSLSLLLLILSANVFSQQKIVVMDPDAVLLNSAYAQKQLSDLQNGEQYSAMVTRINALRSELGKMQEEEQKNALTWSAEQKQSHRGSMQAKVDELNLVAKQAEDMNNRVLNAVQRELTPVLEKVVTALVAEKGYELILNNRAIIYSTEQNTITQLVIDALDQEMAKNAAQ